MVSTEYTHVSVLATDLDESVDFYETVFGMERIASPSFSVPVQWLRCGNLQLHLFKRDIEPVEYFHFGLHVEDFEEVYTTIRDHGIASFDVVGGTGEEITEDTPDVYELPDGSVQMYIRDPTGNLVEVNYPDVEAIDRAIVSEIIDRNDLQPQTGEAANAVLYHEELLADIDAQCSQARSDSA